MAVGKGVAVGRMGKGVGDGGAAVSQSVAYVGVGELDPTISWGCPLSSVHVKPYHVIHAPSTATITNMTMTTVVLPRLGRGYTPS